MTSSIRAFFPNGFLFNDRVILFSSFAVDFKSLTGVVFGFGRLLFLMDAGPLVGFMLYLLFAVKNYLMWEGAKL